MTSVERSVVHNGSLSYDDEKCTLKEPLISGPHQLQNKTNK